MWSADSRLREYRREPLAPALLLLALGACGDTSSPHTSLDAPPAQVATGSPVPVPLREEISPRLLRRFRPVADSDSVAPPASPEMVDLGQTLWYDPRLSAAGDISCNTCHALTRYGMDSQPVSPGHGGIMGRRNTPTVYNAAEHFALHWDGRAGTVEAQAVLPLLGAHEMGSTMARVEATLDAIPGYQPLFRAAFPADEDPLSLANVALALGAFERGLVTPSRWDDYLAGDDSALTDAEVAGLRVFLEVGCQTCHTGPQVGASLYEVAGAKRPWPNQTDQGRYEISRDDRDRMRFKVPTLKNVVKTAPYFHDGSVSDLPEAIRVMGRHQLDLELEDAEVDAIISFLGALTGELPLEYIDPPPLPSWPEPSAAAGAP